MRAAGKTIVTTFLLTAGFVIGAIATDDPEPAPPPPPRVVEVPKYVERVKTVERKVVPQECKEAIAESMKVRERLDKYEASVGALPQLIDDSYQAIYNRDLTQLNDLKRQQIELEGRSVSGLQDISDSISRMNKLAPKCDEALR